MRLISPFYCCLGTALFLSLSALSLAQEIRRAEAVTKPTQPEEPVATHRLYWRSGEWLDGSILGLDANTLSWRSSLTEQPILLARSSVKMANALLRPADKLPKPAPAEWSLLLRNGDSVHGSALAFTKDQATLDTSQHGKLSVPLKQLRSARRLTGASLIFAGPTNRFEWSMNGQVDQGGSLQVRRWNGQLKHSLELPVRVEVSFRLRSPVRPEFSLLLADNDRDSPRLTTWRDRVVLLPPHGHNTLPAEGESGSLPFVPLLTLGSADRMVELRWLVDREARHCLVLDGKGKRLGEMRWSAESTLSSSAKSSNKPSSAQKLPELFFRNLGQALILDDVRVRPWDGKSTDMGKAEGFPIIESFRDGQAKRERRELAGLDLANVHHVTLSQDFVPLSKPGRAVFFDGTVLTGPVVGQEGSRLTMQPSWSEKPIKASAEGLNRLTLEEPEKPVTKPELSKLDLLRYGSNSIHGQLMGDGGSQPLWQFEGASQPQRLRLPSKPDAWHVQLAAGAASASIEHEKSALLFTRSGEVLSSELISLDEQQGITYRSRWSAGQALSHDQLYALSFSQKKLIGDGFRDQGWAILGKSPKLVTLKPGAKPSEDQVMLLPGGIFGHPALMTGDDIRFRVFASGGWGGLGVTVFGDHEVSSTGLKIILYLSGDSLYVVTGDGNRGVSSDQILRNLDRNEVDIRLTFQDNRVQVYANETRLLNQVLPPPAMRGRALLFTPSTLWGNSPYPVEVKAFAASTSANNLASLSTSAEARRAALTVPRFRRENLPKQLLIAGNGDIIRGTLEAATGNLLRLRSGLETIDVPADRVQAIVWLEKPKPASEAKPTAKAEPAKPKADRTSSSRSNKESPPPPPAEPASKAAMTHWLVMQDQSRLALQVEAFHSDKIIGTSALLGRFELPRSAINQLRWAAEPLSPSLASYRDWQLENAPEPVLPETGGQAYAWLDKPAPDFELPLLDEGEFKLAGAKGQVLVLDFWATWCGPCIASMPGLLKVIDKHQSPKVRFLCINQGETAKAVHLLLDRRKWKLPVALDSDGAIGRLYNVEGIPHTIVISPQGKVVWSSTGVSADGEAKLSAAIEKALGEPQP